MLSFTPFPVLTTNRLILRRLEDTDDHQIFLLRTNDRVNEYIPRTKQRSVKEAQEFIHKMNEGVDECKWIFWAINRKGSSELAGTICLWNFSEDKSNAEVGYELHPAFQGQGIMDESLKKVLEFGFHDLNLTMVQAYTHKDNVNSTKLLLKNGFVHKEDGIYEDDNFVLFAVDLSV